MSYIYKTPTGATKSFNGEKFPCKMSKGLVPALDLFVDANFLQRESIVDRGGIAGEAIAGHRVIFLNTGKMYAAQYPRACDGIHISGANVVNSPCDYVNKGKGVILVGNVNISSGAYIVAGPGGVATPMLEVAQVLANAIAGAATGDFDNSIWAAAGEVATIRTTADVAAARGKSVTLYFINDSDVLDSETIVINATNSSTVVAGVKKVKALLAYTISASITATLQIRDVAENLCMQQVNPATGTVYGGLTPTTTNAYGHRVKLTAGSAVTGSIVVVGTNGAGAVVSEVVTFTAETTKYSTYGFATVTGLYIGADGVATQTWTIGVDADVPSYIIGKAAYGQMTKNTNQMLEVMIPSILPTLVLQEGQKDMKGSANTDAENADADALPTNGGLLMAATAIAAGAFAHGTLSSPDCGRNVCVCVTNDSGGPLDLFEGVTTFTVTGTYKGAVVTEDITFESSAANKAVATAKFRAKYGIKPFDTITDFVVDANVPADGLKISLGVGSKIALYNDVFTVLKAVVSAVNYAVASKIDYTNNTLDVGAIADNADYTVTYSVPIG